MIKPYLSRNQIFFLWQKYISSDVNLKELDNNITILLRNKITIDYIIFCLEYVIHYKLNLKYPAGLKYFINRDDIKRAYNLSKIKRIELYEFNIEDDVDSPKFNYTIQESGFQKILKKDKNLLDKQY